MVEKTVDGTARIYTQITHRNLYTKPWTTFFKIIKESITDPKERGVTWVYGSQPKWIINSTDSTELKENYPIVIIPNIEVANQENYTLDYSAKQYVSQNTIEIYSERNDYLDDVTESIMQIVLDNETFFTSIGLHNLKITTDNVEPAITRDGLKIFHRLINFDYEVVTCVE